ncbi:acyl-CoA carboxylase epsilon subunit [Rhodococcus gannanensis]|uniref:Acyl-CoA carboxylase epsilon subunit n=1 Tax=Rhodococcus gannanensis TaxID=1960308 RepID=A0ABW4P7B2_9NOCA
MTAVLEPAAVAIDEAALLDAAEPQQDPIRFSGNPDDTEIAAVLAVLAALRASAPAAEDPQPEEGWGAPAQMMRYGLSAAPTAFVNSRYAR